MIFTKISALQSEQLLKESGSNWLLRETENPYHLSLDYIENNGTLASVLLCWTNRGWQIYEEVGEKNSAFNKRKKVKLKVSSANEDLQLCIVKAMNNLHMSNKIDWLLPSHVQLVPEQEEITQNDIYSDYVKNPDVNKEKLEPEGLFSFDVNNWVHRVALQNCLLDKRLYPYEIFRKIIFTAHNSKTISKIRNELAKLFRNEQPKLDDTLRSHPYYKKIVEAYNYRVNSILKEFSSEQIHINEKLVADANSLQKPQELPLNNKSEKECKPVKNNIMILSNGDFSTSATCQGDRPYQEDSSFIIDDIKLDPSWKDRIPELLVYTVQQLAAEVYAKFPAESSEQGIGTTLSLVFIWNGIAYIAWLGDSPIIKITTADNQKVVTAEYLSWLHRCKHRTENQEILIPQEKERIEKESGKILEVKGSYKLNGFLAMTRSLGDRTPGLGIAVSDIPSVVPIKLNDKSETFILASDGIETLSLKQLTEIFQATPINKFAETSCRAAYMNAPAGEADNITNVVFQGKDGIFCGLFDGHALKKGHLLSEFCSALAPKLFKTLAETKAPQPVANKTEINSSYTSNSNSTLPFFSGKRNGETVDKISQQSISETNSGNKEEESLPPNKKIKIETVFPSKKN